MKLPEPIGIITAKLGEHCSFKSNALSKGDSIYSEAQLREALASHEAVMRQALDALLERDEYRKGEVQYAALKALDDALK